MIKSPWNRRNVLSAGGAAALSTFAGGGFAQTATSDYKILARGLTFTEAPVAMSDGSVVFVEIPAGKLNRVTADGKLSVIVQWTDGPNGAAIGPDGGCYVMKSGSRNRPGAAPTAGPALNGSVARVDLASGATKTLYTQVNGRDLGRLDDVVFDEWGDMWITDLSENALYWARTDGSEIRLMASDLPAANGTALSPDHRTLYVLLGREIQLVSFTITGRGQLATEAGKPKLNRLAKLSGDFNFDSMGIEADGSVLACAVKAGISRFAPDGALIEQIPFKDFCPVNLSFGGPDMRMLYLTGYPPGSEAGQREGRVISLRWPRPGLKMLYRRYG